jgi:raffinose/stachyose/melibiose transport system permease protein
MSTEMPWATSTPRRTEPERDTRRSGVAFGRGALFCVLALWAVTQLFPIVWMFVSSLKTEEDFVNRPFSLPGEVNVVQNYTYTWTGGPTKGVVLSEYTLNSVVVAIPSLLIMTLVSTLAAYALARLPFRGRKIVLSFFIALIAVPVHAVIISVYRLMVDLHLTNTYQGLILVYVAFGIPFSVTILQAYFRSFQQEMIDAARIDGCSDLGAFWRVVFPVSLGAISTVIIVNFIVIWNEFLFAFVLNSTNHKTLTVGLMGYRGQYWSDQVYMITSLCIATIPALLFYFMFQRNIIKGATLGAVKG